MQRPRIDDLGRSDTVLFRLMRMAIKQVVEMATLLQIAQEPFVVPVNPRELGASELEIAKRFVQRGAALGHRLAQAGTLRITVAEHEMRGQAVEQLHRRGIL